MTEAPQGPAPSAALASSRTQGKWQKPGLFYWLVEGILDVLFPSLSELSSAVQDEEFSEEFSKPFLCSP